MVNVDAAVSAVSALSRQAPGRELLYFARVVSANPPRVAVSGITPEPLACRWLDGFRPLIDSGQAVGRSVVVAMVSGQPVIIGVIDESG